MDEHRVDVIVAAELPAVSGRYVMTYGINGFGEVTVSGAYSPGADPLPMMPRFGTELVLAPGLDQVDWVGRGDETYIDRRFAPIGKFSSTVKDLWVEYARAQENGNRTDVSWLEFRTAEGTGLRFARDRGTVAFRASHVNTRDLESAAYSFQLPKRPEVYLNLDDRQMGVGGINSWSALGLPMEAYRIAGTDARTFGFTITPISR